jgi:hypothetical protein
MAVSAFEFFFSFYGLLLGLSVAELVGGFARVLHEKQRIRFGWLTPMLALFVAIDIATFWNQAWVIFRGAPFNTFLLLVSLSIAATFYVAASVTFPRVSAEGAHERVDLDADGVHELSVGDSLFYLGGTPHRWSSTDGLPYRLFVVKQHLAVPGSPSAAAPDLTHDLQES